MKIIEHPEWFEVQSGDGETLKRFYFDTNPGRRQIGGKPPRKRALQDARAFAGKGHEFIAAPTSPAPKPRA